MKLLTICLVVGISCSRLTVKQPIPNNVIFEKIEYTIFNKTLITDTMLSIKLIARNVLRINGTLTFTESVNAIWVHAVLNYKYTTYQKYLVDQWMDVCSLLESIGNDLLAQVIWENFSRYLNDSVFNFELRCPFYGVLTATNIRGLNVSTLVIPLLQAGRYRADLHFAPRRNGPIYAISHIYARISDLRVWF